MLFGAVGCKNPPCLQILVFATVDGIRLTDGQTVCGEAAVLNGELTAPCQTRCGILLTRCSTEYNVAGNLAVPAFKQCITIATAAALTSGACFSAACGGAVYT